MKKKLLAGLATGLFFIGSVGTASAVTILSQTFDGGGTPAVLNGSGGTGGFWGITDLASTPFLAGGTQSGNVLHGVFGDPGWTLDFTGIPTGFTNLELSLSLAAVQGIWEDTGIDGLLVADGVTIDSFLPSAPANSDLYSTVHGTGLTTTFQEFTYNLPDTLSELSFLFSSTTTAEQVGIDTIRITADYVNGTPPNGYAPVPEPATMLMLGTGLVGLAGSRARRKKKA